MTAAFNSFQTKQYVGSLSLAISGSIDANVLGKVTVGSLGINCYSSSLPLTVNPSAFTGTKLVTSSLTLSGCDLSKLDWTFVTGFTNLSSISISSSSNFHTTFYTLPSASLTKLAILSLASGDLNGFSSSSVNYPAVLEQGLKGLYINSGYGPHADSGPQYTTTGMSDTAIEFFLAKWVTPTSSKTLNNLALNNLYLTRIPSDVFKYTNLTKFEIKDNRKFLVVQANSFNISQRNDDGLPFQLTLYNNYITTIQAGAFQGICVILANLFYIYNTTLNGLLYIIGSYANSSLSINYDSGLTTFDSGVFETLLQQMTQPGSYGRIDVTNSKNDVQFLNFIYVCPCNIFF